MILLTVIALIFLSLMLFPFLLARASLDPVDKRSLTVKSDNVRDPRYFSKAFTALMDKALVDYDGGGVIKLSKPEALVEPPILTDVVDAVVFSRGDFRPGRVCDYNKEIYCRADGDIPAGTEMRAIAALGDLVIRENCKLHRWADGERSLSIMEGCSLGLSVTGGAKLNVAPNCEFRRLYSPEICIGATSEPLNPAEPVRSGTVLRELDGVEDMDYIDGDILTRKDFTVGEFAVVAGHLKTRKNVHVKRGARIMGNLIAEGDVIIETDVFIGGVVFSQSWVYIGPGSQIGREGRIKSVVAKCGVVLSDGVRVFGYVGGEQPGETVEAGDYFSVISDKY